LKIFTGNANITLAEEIAAHLGIPVGECSATKFNNGEIQVIVNESVRGDDVFIIQPTCSPPNDTLMELLIIIDAMRRASARRITAVLPFYGYARQDRKTRGREPITAKLVANLITTALTLARENIPCAHAAYNERDVVLTTPLLDPRRSLVQALNLSGRVSVFANPMRYRETANVARLKTDIGRLKGVQTGPAGKLAALLQIEYSALSKSASNSPATKALNAALANVRAWPNIVLLSHRNNDAVALEITRHLMEARGFRVMLTNFYSNGRKRAATSIL